MNVHVRLFLSPSPFAIATLLLLTACGGADTVAAQRPVAAVPPAAPAPSTLPTSAPVAASWVGKGVDVAAMDTSVSPGADFYGYANGAWQRATEIPADRSSTGSFVRLNDEAQRRTKGLLEEASANASATGDTKKVGDYYASFMDEAAIEAKGTKPISAPLGRIAKIADKRALATALGASLRADVDALNHGHFHTPHFLGLWAEQDLNDPSRVVPYLLQGGLGMPDRSYYLDDSPKMADLRTKYQAHIAAMFALAGVTHADVHAARVFALERKIAAVHASRVESGDVKKANNPWTKQDFGARAPGLDWGAFFVGAGLDRQTSFIAWHPAAITGLAALVKSEPLESWKDWLVAQTLDEDAACLPKAFADERFAFYETALNGTPQIEERWKRGVRLTDDALEFAVGTLYVRRYFPADRKRAIEGMVDGIKAAFARRIEGLAWMSPDTKVKAKAKLTALVVGVGYPDPSPDYAGLDIVRGDALGNFERARNAEYQRRLAQLGKAPDRKEWAMPPQMVNAVNLPVRNALNFPAAILEPPFYIADATPAVNYAAIGAVIGHEISHSFDDQGALFDATGRVVSWWTPDDFAHFQASGAALAAQFDAYRPFPDVAVNGKLTLGENIADLAGLASAHDAWIASLAGAPAPVVDGLTGEQQFFLSFAQVWASKFREPALRARLVSDGHAPGMYRALTVRNFDAWYAAFGVKPTDPLYLAPSARVSVW